MQPAGLGRCAGCRTWFAVDDEGVEDGDHADGDQRHHPVDHEHQNDADERHRQTQPFVVKLEFK